MFIAPCIDVQRQKKPFKLACWYFNINFKP